LQTLDVYSGEPGAVLRELAPGEDGRTVYVWLNLNGASGVYEVSPGAQPKMLGSPHADDSPVELQSTDKGIVADMYPNNPTVSNPEFESIHLIGWDGTDTILKPASADVGSNWVSGDGHWIVVADGPAQTTRVVVYRDGVASTLSAKTWARVMAMTPSRDAVVYEPSPYKLTYTNQFAVSVLPLSGGPERTVTLTVATTGTQIRVLSGNGVLAYTSPATAEEHKMCFQQVDFGTNSGASRTS
jgi:hypothetical protein